MSSTFRTPPPRTYAANYVAPHGNPNATVYVVVERPGRYENNRRVPLVGDDGGDFNQVWLPMAGLRRSDIRCHNVYPYWHPENSDPTLDEVLAGTPELLADIERVNPRFIVTMGKYALGVFKGVYGALLSMEREHGVPFHWQGRVIIPVFHPSAAWHTKHVRRQMTWDWQRVGEIIRSDGVLFPQSIDVHYSMLGTTWWQQYINMPLAIDTETSDGKPWMIQVSPKPGVAYCCLVNNGADLAQFTQWIEQAPLVILHNAKFDLDILEQCGIIPHAYTDTMIMAYLLGNEHQGLKDLAYKHFGIEMHEYKDVVLPSTQRRARKYLEHIASQSITMTRWFRVKSSKRKRDGWAEFKSDNGIKPLNLEFKQLDSGGYEVTWEVSRIPDPAPVEEFRGKQIVTRQPTNIVKRVRSLLDDLDSDPTLDPFEKWSAMNDKDEAIKLMGGDMTLGSIDEIPLNDAIDYGCRDADMTYRVYNVLRPKIEQDGLGQTLRTDMQAIPFILDMEKAGIRVDAEELERFGAELDERMRDHNMRIQMQLIEHGAISASEVFNPNSHVQVREMLNAYNVDVKTTEIKELEPLVRRVPWLRDHIEYKHLEKLKGTYVNGLLGKIQSDGRVYATFNNNVADTGRLSSSDPNFQNIPVRTADGRRIRKAFVPSQDSAFVVFDYKQIEPRIMAHLSQDPVMLDVFRNNRDPYATTASRVYGVPIDDIDKKTQRDPMKAVYLGVAYLLSPYGLCNDLEYKDVRKADGSLYTEDECAYLIEEFYRVHRVFKQWQDEYLLTCARDGKSRDLFGRYRLVPLINSPNDKYRNESRRDAANNAMQSGAGGVFKRAMSIAPSLYGTIALQTGRHVVPVNVVHDELDFDVHLDAVETWIKTFAPAMENVVQLSVPLGVDVELSFDSWADCKEIGDWKSFNFKEWEKAQDA